MSTRDPRNRPGEHSEELPDPGAAPGVSDAGSRGHIFGGGLAGVGTGTSIGASRGNTGPGTGSDALEETYGTDAPTRFREMVGASPLPGQGEGATPRVSEEEQRARTAQARASRATARVFDRDTTFNTSDTRGRGDDDIPEEDEIA